MELNVTFKSQCKDNRKANLTMNEARNWLSENKIFSTRQNVQRYFGTHTVSYSMDTGLFYGGKAAEV
jgi:hypothetical protein